MFGLIISLLGVVNAARATELGFPPPAGVFVESELVTPVAHNLKWRGKPLFHRADIMAAALSITTPAEVLEFKAELSKNFDDVDDYLGGLVTSVMQGLNPDFIQLERAERFATLFGVEDPVYGTPREIVTHTPHFRKLLNLLGSRLSPADLKRVRATMDKATEEQCSWIANAASRVDRRRVNVKHLFSRWKSCQVLLNGEEPDEVRP